MDQAPDGEGSTDWVNTEYRSFHFTDEKDAHLKETEESQERRREKPVSGADAKEPLLKADANANGDATS